MSATPITAQSGQISQESKEAIEWLVNDARYLARQARIYRERGLVWLLAESAADKWLKSQNLTKIKKEIRNVKSMPVRTIQHR